MQFFTEAAGKLPVLKDLKSALAKGITPVSLTGVSQIHKAQILLTLAQEQPLLAVLPDESAVRQICEREFLRKDDGGYFLRILAPLRFPGKKGGKCRTRPSAAGRHYTQVCDLREDPGRRPRSGIPLLLEVRGRIGVLPGPSLHACPC